MTAQNNDDLFSHSVVLSNHPFRTSTQEAIRTLSAGVGKGSSRAQTRRSSHASLTLQNHSTTSIQTVQHPHYHRHHQQEQEQQQRSSTLSPQKSVPIDGGNVEQDLVMESVMTDKSSKSFMNRLSGLFMCGRNPTLYDQEVEADVQTVIPRKKTQNKSSLKRRSSFFSLSARNPMSIDVEFEEAHMTNAFPLLLPPPPPLQPPTEVGLIQPVPQLPTPEFEKNIHGQQLTETPVEVKQANHELHEAVKEEILKEMTLPQARRYDTVPSSEACEYTGRVNIRALERKASSPPPPSQHNESKLIHPNDTRHSQDMLPLPDRANRRESARSLRSYVSSSSLYSAASAQERAFVNTPGEISLSDNWGMATSPSRSITSTQLAQSPFMFDLLAKFPGLSNSTTQQPSGLRHMLDSEKAVDEERVKTPHPPGFMADEDSETEPDNLWQKGPNDTPPARLKREGTTMIHESVSPTSSFSNSTLDTPSPPITTAMNKKRLALLNGGHLENDFAARMASMDNVETDWRDNLIGMYTDDDIIIPFTQTASQQHRESVSSTTDSFHSIDLYQPVEEGEVGGKQEDFAMRNNFNFNDNSKLYESAPVPPPDVPLPPIPAHNAMEAQSFSRSQRTIRKAASGNRHRGNSDASAHSNATMKAVNRSKHSKHG